MWWHILSPPIVFFCICVICLVFSMVASTTWWVDNGDGIRIKVFSHPCTNPFENFGTKSCCNRFGFGKDQTESHDTDKEYLNSMMDAAAFGVGNQFADDNFDMDDQRFNNLFLRLRETRFFRKTKWWT